MYTCVYKSVRIYFFKDFISSFYYLEGDVKTPNVPLDPRLTCGVVLHKSKYDINSLYTNETNIVRLLCVIDVFCIHNFLINLLRKRQSNMRCTAELENSCIINTSSVQKIHF